MIFIITVLDTICFEVLCNVGGYDVILRIQCKQ